MNNREEDYNNINNRKEETNIQINQNDSHYDDQSNNLYITSFLEEKETNNNNNNNKVGKMTYICGRTKLIGESLGALYVAYALIIIPTIIFYAIW